MLTACANAPAPVIAGLMPEEVCGSGTLPLAVSGDHFLARPVRTLAGTVALEVPDAQLIPASGTTVHPEVVWFSTQRLSLKVPLDQLTTGSYALTLVDPDGQEARKDDALSRVEVPPVMVAMVSPPAICIATANSSITVQGSGFVDGATVSIRDGAGTVVQRPSADLGHDSVTVTLAAGSLMPGDYTLVVENPSQAGCSATAAAPLTIDPPPTLTSVTGAVCGNGGQLRVAGDGLAAGATVELRQNMQTVLTATQVNVMNAQSATVSFPSNNLPNNSRGDLYWHNGDGCGATLVNGVRVKPGQGGCF
jgi:hypothetical protein